MEQFDCDGATLDDSLYTGMTIPPIDEKTIECNITRFAAWLNKLAEQVNYLSCLYLDMKAIVKENRERIICLESKVENIEEAIQEIQNKIEQIENLIEQILGGSGDINQAINLLNGRIDFLYSLLPIPYGLISAKGWKFAMGNINVMSANSGTPSVDGPGIFTAGVIENNDLYFN
jgi:hypothetical protein